MTMVLIERRNDHAYRKAAEEYLRSHGFLTYLNRAEHTYDEMVKEFAYLAPCDPGCLSKVLWVYPLDEFVGTVEIMFRERDRLRIVETTIYGPGVQLGTASPPSGARRRAVRV